MEILLHPLCHGNRPRMVDEQSFRIVFFQEFLSFLRSLYKAGSRQSIT